MHDIGIVITTRNRADLFERLVESILASEMPKDRYKDIFVYDDCSDEENLARISAAFSMIDEYRGVNINNARKGCDRNTPESVLNVLEMSKSKVLILDSDTVVGKDWYWHVQRCIETMERDKKIAAIQILNLENIKSKKAHPRYTDLLLCDTLTACGLIVTREYYDRFVFPFKEKYWWRWDMGSAEMARSCGFEICCLDDSAIQHTGEQHGTHSGAGQTATRFKDVRLAAGSPVSRMKGGITEVYITASGFHGVASALVTKRFLDGKGILSRIFTCIPEWDKLVDSYSRDASFENRHYFMRDDNGIIGYPQNKLPPNIAHISCEFESDAMAWKLYSYDNDIAATVTAELSAFLGERVELDWNWLARKELDAAYKNVPEYGTIFNGYEGATGLDLSKHEDAKCVVFEFPACKTRTESRKYVRAKPLEIINMLRRAKRFVSYANKSSFMSLFAAVERELITTKGNSYSLPGSHVVTPYQEERYRIVAHESIPTDFFGHQSDKPEYQITIHEGVRGFYNGWILDLIEECKEFGGMIIVDTGPVALCQIEKVGENATKATNSRKCRLIRT